MKSDHISGFIAAPFTPFFPDQSINPELIPAYYHLLKKNQVGGAFICGTTGEGAAMTYDEKLSIARAWADACGEDDTFKVILFIGGTSIQESIALARESQRIGVDAIASTAPYYNKPDRISTLTDCILEIAHAVPAMPYYYYHIPVLTGVDLPMIDLLKTIDGKATNIAGIKYTNDNLMDFASCVQYQNRKYQMLWGRDESWLAALALGARGAVGSTYNYAAKLYHEITFHFEKSDIKKAQNLQYKSIDMIRLLSKYGGMPTGKAYMKWIGLDCGECRLPFKNMSDDDYLSFVKDAQSLQLDDYWASVD